MLTTGDDRDEVDDVDELRTLATDVEPAAPRRSGRVVSLAALATMVATLAVVTALEWRIASLDLADGTFPRWLSETGHGIGVTGVLMTGGAALVLWRVRGSGRGFGWALLGTGVFWGSDALAQTWVRLAVAQDELLPGLTFAAWYLFRPTALLPVTIVLLALLFPTGRFPGGLWRVVCWTAVAVGVVGVAAFIVAPAGTDNVAVTLPVGVDLDPTTIVALGPVLDVFVPAVRVLAAPFTFVLPVGVAVHRYRRSSGRSRRQMRWLLWAVLVSVLLVATIALLRPPEVIDLALTFVIVNLVPAAMVVALTDPDLVSIDDLLGRTLVYGVLAVVLVATDLALVAGLTTLLGDRLEQRQVVVLVLLVSIVLYGPLRMRLAALVRRRLLGDRDDPFGTVAGLASTLETTDDARSQLAAVAGAVARAFGVRYVLLEVSRGGGERIVAVHGDEPTHVRALPIAYRGAEVGRLVLPARGARSRLNRRDEQLLGDLVRQAVTAIRTGRLADELQESRERLVTAREEERRRIRRDLHDGLGPALSGVVFQLESARLLVDTDAERAKAGIAGTSTHLQDVVADVRRLVHDLRPPALDDLGLVGALRQQAERVSLPVTVEADGVDDLPAAVEVAAYRIAGESLTNVVRHARATSARICLAVTERLDAAAPAAGGRALMVEVADDGIGIPTDVEAGVGLISLRERADELGGSLAITCPEAGGTVVRAWLPLRHDHTSHDSRSER